MFRPYVYEYAEKKTLWGRWLKGPFPLVRRYNMLTTSLIKRVWKGHPMFHFRIVSIFKSLGIIFFKKSNIGDWKYTFMPVFRLWEMVHCFLWIDWNKCNQKFCLWILFSLFLLLCEVVFHFKLRVLIS
jgi:hypothetical protein